MKKLFLCSLIFLAAISASAQMAKINELFEQYDDVPGVTSIRIAKPMFKMLNSLNLGDEDLAQIKPLIKEINSIQILIFQGAAKKDSAHIQNITLQQDLQKSIYKAIKNLHFEELMSINSNGSKIKFLSENTTADVLHKLVLSINANEQNLLLLLDGNISMKDLSKLINDEGK